MLQQVGDGPVRSFHAMAGTGVVVMLHFLEGSEEANNLLLALVDRLKPNERKRVLDVTAVEGKPVIVTRFILDFRSLEEWLRAHQLKDAAAPDAALPSQTPPAPLPGPTTSTFNAVLPPTLVPPVAATPAPPSLPAEPAPLPPPPAARTPGDFTLMFSKPDQLPEAPREPSEFTREFSAPKGIAPVPPPPSAPLQPPSSTGEFTGVFRAELPGKPTGSNAPPAQPTVPPPVAPPPAPVSPVVPPAPQQPPAAGDFTRMFRADLVNPRPAEPAAPPPVFPGPVTPSGSATSSFEAPQPPPPPVTPPQQPTSDTGFTQLFSAPTAEKRYTAPSFGGPVDAPKANVPSDNYLNRLGSSGSAPPNPQSGPPAFEPNWGTPPPPAASHLPPPGQAYVPPPVMPPPSQLGPSEYTRVISQPGFDPRSLMAPGGYVPPPPPSAPPASASPKTPKIVIIGLIAVVVIAVATVLFFVLK